jgi:periplasmic divalent cation tolerance protein
MAPADFCVVLVTAPTRADAETIARAVLGDRLAACVNLWPVQSLYTWQGTLETADEYQLVIKTQRSRFPALETKIRAIHPYDLPEMIALPLVAGSEPYLTWIHEQTQDPPQEQIGG